MQLLTFTLCGGNFGIPLKDIELVEKRSNEIVEMPVASAYIKGIATIREHIVPIYSLASRLGYDTEKSGYFVIIDVEGTKLGIEVDRLNAVIEAEDEKVLSVPSILSGGDNYLGNIVVERQKQLIILIDVNSLVTHDEKMEINRLISEKGY